MRLGTTLAERSRATDGPPVTAAPEANTVRFEPWIPPADGGPWLYQ